MSEEFARAIRAGGVVVFPADTVYGLACDPENPEAVARMYALKRRDPAKPAALMRFSVAALPPLAPRTRRAAHALLPGPVTLLVPGEGGTVGLRVPDVPLLRGLPITVLQSSANHAGGPDARTLAGVPLDIREGADLVLDGGELPGVPSTVVDLTEYEATGAWTIVREGALARAAVAAVL